jgi:hypothetical protein
MNSEEDKRDHDGIARDDVSYYVADSQRHRLYIAGLDGTGNDEIKPQFGPKTNVAKTHDQIKAQSNNHIYAGYTPDPGTQDGWLAHTRDHAIVDQNRWLEAGEMHA